MLTTNAAFEKFKSRLELSETEKQDASRREKDVRRVVDASFDVERDFLAGSYGRHTKTKPLKDVDIFVVLGEKEKHRRNKPAIATLDDLEDCLVKEYGRDAVTPGRRCITVEFEKEMYAEDTPEKVLSVDVIPAFESGSDYEIPDRDKKGWIKTNPEVHADKATAKNKSLDGKWKPLVKMAKSWNRYNGKPIKPSFLIEVMALDLLNGPFTTYDEELRSFFAAAQGAIEKTWPDPAGLGPAVSDQMTPELVEKAKTALAEAERKAARAARATSQGRQGEALDLWQEILGPHFSKT
ncbi:MAG TPA: CBASS oligonucleotide cyclase [Gammaproteobacteria bacterium]|jgi:hypothetical protein